MKHFSSGWPALRLAVALLSGTPAAHAQAPTWQTAAALGGTTSAVYATASDAAGNVFLTGRFSGTLTLGSSTLTSAGDTDGFVAKYNVATGNYGWALRFGGSGTDRCNAIAVAGTSIYVAGSFDGTATVGGLTLTSACSTDVAVLKLTDQGTAPVAVWAQPGGGPDGDEGWALAVSGTSVYVGGQLSSASVFGSVAVPVTTSMTAGFVAKLTDAGTTATYAWAQTLGGPYYDAIYALAADGASVYAGGFFYYNMTLGGTPLTSAGLSDAVVVKLTDNGATGSPAWVRQMGGTGADLVEALVAGGGTVYATGAFNATATFGALSLVSAGRADVFVAKLADAGATATYAWVQQAGGPGDDIGFALVARAGSVYLAGGTSGGATFGPSTVASAGGYDAFVARLTDAGPSARFIWTQVGGGTASDIASALAVANNRLYVGGVALLPATFGALALTGTGSSGFLATLASGALATVPAAAAEELAAFPNPVAARATVRVPAATAATRLVLRDALSRTVAQATGSALPVPALPAGVYVLHATAPGQAAAHTRLVVE